LDEKLDSVKHDMHDIFPVFGWGYSILNVIRESIWVYGWSSCIQEISRDITLNIGGGGGTIDNQIKNILFFDYSDDKENNVKAGGSDSFPDPFIDKR